MTFPDHICYFTDRLENIFSLVYFSININPHPVVISQDGKI